MDKDHDNNSFNSESGNFGLPESYFQKSANSIFNKVEWLQEHKQFVRLSELKNGKGFIVPENYFETSECKLELIYSPHLFSRTKDPGFKIPPNYFEDKMVDALQDNLKEDENELSPNKKSHSFSKQNPFDINADYFTQSERKITAAIFPSVRIVKLFHPKIWYSAAAAIFAIAIGVWVYSQYFSINDKDCGTLACIEKRDLLKSNNLENLESDELYELVDSKKLEEKLEKKPSKNKADTSFKNISAEDLLDEI